MDEVAGVATFAELAGKENEGNIRIKKKDDLTFS